MIRFSWKKLLKKKQILFWTRHFFSGLTKLVFISLKVDSVYIQYPPILKFSIYIQHAYANMQGTGTRGGEGGGGNVKYSFTLNLLIKLIKINLKQEIMKWYWRSPWHDFRRFSPFFPFHTSIIDREHLSENLISLSLIVKEIRQF